MERKRLDAAFDDHVNGAAFHVACVGTGKPLLLSHGAAAEIAKFFTRIG